MVAGWGKVGATRGGSLLVERQVAVGHTQGEDCHAGAVGVAGFGLLASAAGEVAVVLLQLEQGLAELGIDRVPVFAAELVERLGAVIDAVEIELLPGVVGGILDEVFAAGDGLG